MDYITIDIKEKKHWENQTYNNKSAAVLSRYNLINASTHRETSCGYALNSIGCWWDF